MSYAGPQAPRIGEATLRDGRPAPPAGSRWWPGTWIRLLVWKWKLGGTVEPAERRGYWFWIPIVVTILVIELLGALSSSFNNAIPWPTISSTIGHLEKRWDWVGIIVVGLLTAVAFHAVAYGGPAAEGRALRESGGDTEEWRWYSWPFVVLATGAAIGLAIGLDATKYEYGYVIYGVLAGLGIVLPGVLSFGFHRLVRFPTLFFAISKLRHRLHSVALILITGLTILAVHLAFYPWPDITHESASFAGLNPAQAQIKAERELKKLRGAKPRLPFSTQAKGVNDGQDVWLVYFRPGCVITVTKNAASASPECSR
jgi:hypothetical protein